VVLAAASRLVQLWRLAVLQAQLLLQPPALAAGVCLWALKRRQQQQQQQLARMAAAVGQ
jgi:hypothetical protein